MYILQSQVAIPIERFRTGGNGRPLLKVPIHLSHFLCSSVSLQNGTIEERVTFLEVQMTDIQDDIAEVKDEVAFMFDEVAELDDEQNLQDQRIFTLEQETSGKITLPSVSFAT